MQYFGLCLPTLNLLTAQCYICSFITSTSRTNRRHRVIICHNLVLFTLEEAVSNL